MSGTKAYLSLNDGNTNLELDPSTVSADSVMPITDLLRNDGDDSFSSGDCFQFEFQNVKEYDEKKPGHYWPIVEEPTVCQFNVGATCTKMTNFIYKVQLNGDTPDLTGTIGKIKNPYSFIPSGLKLIEIRYYAGCSSETPTDSTSTEFTGGFTLELTPAIIPAADVTFTVSREIVGDADRTNIATFTFTPKTKLSSLGGFVRIITPKWYDSEKNPELPYEEKNFECASTSFATIGRQRSNRRTFRINGVRQTVYWYEIPYSALVPYPKEGPASTLEERLLAAETRPVTLSCSYWRNPILPAVTPGYQISTEDYDGAAIDESEQLTLDASNFTPYQIPDENVVYTLSTPTVQV